MTRVLPKESVPTVASSSVCPGIIETESGKVPTRTRKPELAQKIALQRIGKPADVAQTAAFLAAAEPFFITGHAITIDGVQWES